MEGRRAGLIGVAALALTAAWILASRPPAPAPEPVSPPPAAGPSVAATAAPAGSPAAVPVSKGGFVAGTRADALPAQGAPSARAARRRSPLERSPGYYPPNDPESLSVAAGRREAPSVDLPLEGGAPTMRDLALDLLDALRARDARALHALRVTREEFERILWPEFPESRPVTNITAEDAWEPAQAGSLSGAERAIGSFGGRTLELLRVESAATVSYRNFTLHRGISILARDIASGEVFTMRFASSFVERGGRFKVLLYRD